MPLAFEQQPKESDKAYAAFRAYLDFGPQRSLAAVAQKLAKSEQLMKRWSAKFTWLERVQAYAGHLAMIEREAIEGLAVEKAVDWNKVHEPLRIAEWQRHKKLIALADKAIARWEKNEGRCGTLEGIARILDLATKLGRLAAGLPTEVKAVNTTVTGTIDVEWEIALRKAYGQVAPVGDQATPPAIVEVEAVPCAEPKPEVKP